MATRAARIADAGLPEPLLLDGEIVAWTRPARRRSACCNGMHVRDPRQIARKLIGEVPMSLRLFDLPRCARVVAGGNVRRPAVGAGVARGRRPVLGATAVVRRRRAGTGIVRGDRAAKAWCMASNLRPGRRRGLGQGQAPADPRRGARRLAPGEGNREGRIGSLYCCAYDGDELVLIGKVGSGWTPGCWTSLGAELAALEVDEPPFDPRSIPGPTGAGRTGSIRCWSPR